MKRYLTQQKVYDVKDHVKRELGCEECEEPLGGVHVCFQTQVQEVCVQVWNAFLQHTEAEDTDSTGPRC